MKKENRTRAYRSAPRGKKSAYVKRKEAYESGTLDVPEGREVCPECFRIVKLHTDGTRWGHHSDWGVICKGGMAQVSGGQKYVGPRAVCPVCGAKRSLNPDGTLRAHRITAAVGKPFCAGSGTVPP